MADENIWHLYLEEDQEPPTPVWVVQEQELHNMDNGPDNGYRSARDARAKKSATDNATDRTAYYTIYDVLVNIELQDPLQKTNQNNTKAKNFFF